MMRFEVLGVLRVVDAGVEVAVNGQTQRRVLAALVSRADGQVSLAELVDALWPEAPPGNAVKNVQSYIAKLRHALGDPNVIGSGPGGYGLAVGQLDLDAQEFAEAVRRAQASDDVGAARSELDRVFGLWRGRPYADLESWSFLRPEVERLEQLRLDALGVGVEVGMHVRVLPELTALVGECPYREGAVALLMRALHAAGRQAEAQELYWRTKTRLAEELGVDPTPELQDLYQALLQGEARRASVSRRPRSESKRDPTISYSAPDSTLSPTAGRFEPTSTSRVVLVEGMPRPPRAYQERIDQLQTLCRLGDRNEPAVVCSLTGARGVGKTQLAASYARLRLAQGWGVIWIDAESREHMVAGLADLADVLNLRRTGEDVEYAAMRARRWLSECPTPVLLVLDNAVEPDVIRQWQPRSGSVQVVVTSNRRVFGWLGEDVEVDVFTSDTARAFLRECTDGLAEDGTDDLIDALGGYPLALALAAAVISRERLSCAEYLRRLSALPLDAAFGSHESDPYPRGVADAIRLSFAAVEMQTHHAHDLAELVAVLSPAGVGRSLLVPEDAPEDVRAERSGALGLLADVSLISYSQDGHAVIMHRLTRRTIREYAARHGRLTTAVTKAIALLDDRLQTSDQTPDMLTHVESLLELVDETTLDHDHLTALLNLGERTVATYSGPTVAAFRYADRGSVDSLNRILHTHQERALGPDHPATLRSRSIQAGYCRTAGRIDESISIAEQTLALQARALGTDHPDTLKTRFHLAMSYTAAGRSYEAIPFVKVTITAQERVLGRECWATLQSRSHLAWACRSLGWMNTAVELGRQAVADHVRVLGHDHPDSLSSRSGLGCILRQAGDINRSIQLLEQCVAGSDRVIGADLGSSLALSTRSHLAGAYRAAGRNDEAVEMLEQIVLGWERYVGPGHYWTLCSRNNLACAYASAERFHEATDVLEQTLNDFELAIGHNQTRTLNVANNLACVYVQAGDLHRAIPLLNRNVAERERLLGPNHPDTCTSAHNLGAAYHQIGCGEDATSLFEQSCRTSAPTEDTTWLRNSFAYASMHGIDETIRLPSPERSPK